MIELYSNRVTENKSEDTAAAIYSMHSFYRLQFFFNRKINPLMFRSLDLK